MPLKDSPALQIAESYPLQFDTRILYADMDAFRHLNNGATGRYLEEGRADLNMRVFGKECMIDPPGGLQLLFASVTVEYLLQAYYPGSVRVASGVSRIGNSSYAITQAAFQNGACFALAQAIMVKAIDGRPEPLSPAEREGLAALSLAVPAG